MKRENIDVCSCFREISNMFSSFIIVAVIISLQAVLYKLPLPLSFWCSICQEASSVTEMLLYTIVE
jgi:hypothetical protein